MTRQRRFHRTGLVLAAAFVDIFAMRFLAAVVTVILIASPAHSFSRQHCLNLTKAITDAMNRRDAASIVQITGDFEKECAGIVDQRRLAKMIGTQADALVDLSEAKQAIATADRCLRIESLADCHLAKGRALILLRRTDEARKSLRTTKRLAGVEILRASSKVKEAASELDRELWNADREKYRAYTRAADWALAFLATRKYHKTQSPQISSGTGIVISENGRVLTNYHVVNHCRSIDVFSGGKLFRASLRASDKKTDFAVLETGAHFTSVATFRAGTAEVGEPVAVIGFPLQGILSSGGTVSFGHISALAGIANDWQKLQISAPVQPGNSGGPLFDQGGLLLGVVVQKLDALKVARITGDVPQNINFAIKAEVAHLFLAANGIQVHTAQRQRPLANTELSRAGKELTVLIRCTH